MEYRIGKYEFNSKEQAEDKINALKVEIEEELVANHKHGISVLGHIVVEQREYDAEGNEVKAPILSDKYHVDVAWCVDDLEELDHPYGWKSYAVQVDGEGLHSFSGMNYQSLKLWKN